MLSNEELKEQAYSEGYTASAEGISKKFNPYGHGSARYKEWRAGWDHYDADYNPDYYSLSNAVKNGWL